MIAKEQILREHILEQQQTIGDLNKQIMELKRKMGLLPTASSIARFIGTTRSRKVSLATLGGKSTAQTRKSTAANVLILQ